MLSQVVSTLPPASREPTSWQLDSITTTTATHGDISTTTLPLWPRSIITPVMARR